jgi:hypothetical protein
MVCPARERRVPFDHIRVLDGARRVPFDHVRVLDGARRVLDGIGSGRTDCNELRRVSENRINCPPDSAHTGTRRQQDRDALAAHSVKNTPCSLM